MARVDELRRDALTQLHRLAVFARLNELLHALGVLDGVERLDRWTARAQVLAVLVLGVGLLNVRRILQHDAEELRREAGGDDLALESVLDEQRQTAGVVDVRVRHEHAVDRAGVEGQRGVIHLVAPLLQAAVHQNLLAVDLQTMAAAGYALVSAVKTQLHGSVPFCFRREGQPSPRFVVSLLPLF